MEESSTQQNSANYIQAKAPLSWDEYFMLQAMIASFRSKDPSTKVGAVFVDKNNHQITMGYNGFVAGIDESKLPWGKDENEGLEHQKYAYVVHAEANAILHSPGPLIGTRAYVTLFPCHECAKLIASTKVDEIIYLSDKHQHKDSTKISKRIFDLAGISYRQISMRKNLTENLNEHLAAMLRDTSI